MRFLLTPRSLTLEDLELYKFEFSENFLGFAQISDATTAKRMKIYQYCQRQRRKHVELEQFLAYFRVSRRAGLSAAAGLSRLFCQRFITFIENSIKKFEKHI